MLRWKNEADVVGRCNDKKGSFMVETTAWEGTPPATTTSPEADTQFKHRNTTHWHDGDKTGYFSSG